MTSELPTPQDYPLLTVTVVALASMMFVLVLGTYADALFPRKVTVVVYECDFKMKDHTLTKPCVIRGRYYD